MSENIIKAIFAEQGAEAAAEATRVYLESSLGKAADKVARFVNAEEGLNGFKDWELCDFDETIEAFEVYILSELHFHNLACADR